MLINAVFIFSLFLAGFSALAAAQPHGEHAPMHRRHAKALKERDIVYHVTPTRITIRSTPVAQPTFISVENNVPSPTVSPSSAPTSNKDGKGGDKKDDKNGSSGSNKSNNNTGNGNGNRNSNKGTVSKSGTDSEFPDGAISCGQFPSDYGPMALPWHTRDGWSGLQYGGGNIDHEGVCREGTFCSYACPPGFSKGQWPADQPASGETYGGLLCRNGRLTLTRPNFRYLCEAGAYGIFVRNELSDVVAVCRTDYPGTENMVVPLQCDPGTQNPLTAPDADDKDSFKWRGGSTSAHYYANNAGVSIQDGCRWGQDGGEVGNWAPYVFGAGKKDGRIWISVAKNPNNNRAANYNVSIVGGSSNNCECIMGGCPGGGCTVAVELGQQAVFRLWR